MVVRGRLGQNGEIWAVLGVVAVPVAGAGVEGPQAEHVGEPADGGVWWESLVGEELA